MKCIVSGQTYMLMCATSPCAAQEKDRVAIVKGWAEDAGKEDAPVEELVSAAKFAVALAEHSPTQKFQQQAKKLMGYMQNSNKFSPHLSVRP